MNNLDIAHEDMLFLLRDVFSADDHWSRLPGLGEPPDMDMARTMLEQYIRLCTEELAPLNSVGDRVGVRWQDGQVSTPPGFAEAYRRVAAGGWLTIGGDPAYGGQPCSHLLRVLFDEVGSACNMALGLYLGLSGGTAETIAAHASESLRSEYLPLLYSGSWAGVMCLTEPQAGSDLGLLRCRAEPAPDGDGYLLNGNKIFITGGRQDMTAGIVHLVLARLPGAPAGNAGISMFLVPNRDGGVLCQSVEEKMGIHGSATCSLSFENARGWLVGTEHRGLSCMFTMMNTERLAVGMQGVGCASAALHRARSYAGERLQGGLSEQPEQTVPIVRHADVQRMLITQQSLVEGMRALALAIAEQRDLMEFGPAETTATASGQLALMTPVAKAFFTDMGLDCCVLAQQVFGGYGYVRETGVEQYVRDVRIAQIYEGTNGIQARDLVRRKLRRDRGAGLEHFCRRMEAQLAAHAGEAERRSLYADPLAEALGRLRRSAASIIELSEEEADGCAVEFLHLLGYTALAWVWSRVAAVILDAGGEAHQRADKLLLARFYMEHILPRSLALAASIEAGGQTLRHWGALQAG